MSRWQVLLVFVGIPAAMFVRITVVVLRFTVARVPDGLAHAADQLPKGDDPAPAEHDGTTEDDTQDE